MTFTTKSPYAGYRFPPEVISHAVWPYFRFPLSLRMVDELLAARQRGAGISGVGALTPAPASSGDADGVGASQLQHAVEHVAGNVHLGRPTLIRMRSQPVADHLLPSRDGGLGPGALRVPGRPLPGH